MKRLLTVILVVAIIAGGASGRIPVARAASFAVDVIHTGYVRLSNIGGGTYALAFNDIGDTGGLRSTDTGPVWSTSWNATPSSFSNGQQAFFYETGPYGHEVGYAIYFNEAPPTGMVSVTVGGGLHHVLYSGSPGDNILATAVTYSFVAPVADGNWHTWASVQGNNLDLLSASIAGPSMVETGQSGTWMATASGGTAPYTYEWYLLPAGSSLLGDDPGLIATGTASTFTHTMTVAGAFQVSLTVLDSTGAAVAATATVNVGATLGTGYRIEFARSGTRGLYLAVSVYDGITGIISPIASTSGTQAGWYDNWGTTTNSFHWVASPSEAVWWQAFSWRWTLRFAYPDGSLGPPPEDFWFQTTITLTNGTHLSVMHHFSTYGENSDTWTDDTGAVAVPETPPAAESSLPAWVQELLERFKGVIRWAFVPSATDFSSQVEQGWVVITSPVPTIVPQYTIPFPNPNHLLASTGDSVNIDFSMISTWTYYATVKVLVQVCLDAVLVFIVIGIVT